MRTTVFVKNLLSKIFIIICGCSLIFQCPIKLIIINIYENIKFSLIKLLQITCTSVHVLKQFNINVYFIIYVYINEK